MDKLKLNNGIILWNNTTKWTMDLDNYYNN